MEICSHPHYIRIITIKRRGVDLVFYYKIYIYIYIYIYKYINE